MKVAAVAALTTLVAALLPAHSSFAGDDEDNDVIKQQCPDAKPKDGAPVGAKDPVYGGTDKDNAREDPFLRITRMLDIANMSAAAGYDLGMIAAQAIVNESQKDDRVEDYVGEIQACFPGYNVMVAQPDSMTTQKMKGLLLEKTVSISESDFRVFVFKSGTFHKNGDLGPKNWAYSGFFKKSDGNHTVDFSTHPDATRNSDWYSSSKGEEKPLSCEVNGVKGPDRDMQLDVGGGSDEERADANEKLIGKVKHCYPSHNVLLVHDGGDAHFKGTDSLKMANGDAAYKKKFDIGNRDFWLYVFDKGKVTSTGDGGWLNWGYAGDLKSKDTGDGRTVEFSERKEADLNPDAEFLDKESDFEHRGPEAPDHCKWKSKREMGWGTDKYLRNAESLLAECYPDKNVIMVKGLNKIQFGNTSGLEHVYSDPTYDGFVLDSGTVLNSGDGGYQNWAFHGNYKQPKDNKKFVTFSSKDGGGDDDGGGNGGGDNGGGGDNDGGDDGDHGGKTPDLGSHPATFKVNNGSSSFNASQPADSVATYVMKDGRKPKMTLTSADGSDLKYKMDSFDVTSKGSPSDTISVDSGKTHQKIDGFGGAMTDSAASLIENSSHKGEIMSKLFGTGDGQAGLSIARSPMGSSDLMAGGKDVHTYEDKKGAFSADGTEADKRQIKALQEAKEKAGGDFKLLGTPWTAPGWAKRGGKLLGAECGTEANELDRSKAGDYADYFRKYVDAYDKAGIKPWMVSMQNEPENCKRGTPTTLLNADDEVALSKELKNKLPGDVGVLGWDHNWNDPDYVDTLTGKGRVDAIGYHCYDGTHYGAQTQKAKSLMTECSGFTDQSSDVAGNLGWEVSNLLVGPLRNGSTGSVYWSMAQDGNGGPHLSDKEACQDCRGLLTVNGDGGYKPSQDFYFWGQFGKFVRPGSVRVDSNNSGNLSTVAFKNGDTTTLVVLNSSKHADGGKAGSSEDDFRGKMVQFQDDAQAQKTSWMVGADGYRRWISDLSTYKCLKDDAGKEDAGGQPGGTLDKYVNLKDVWAVCGSSVMGTNSELETGTYLKSKGGAKLALGKDGKLTAKDRHGKTRWTAPATGDRLILQPDGNLVLYDGDSAKWSTKTDGKGGKWLSIRDDGSVAVTTKDDKQLWSQGSSKNSDLKGKIVHWDDDKDKQKTSWLVGYDGKRRVIPDLDTFKCLRGAGYGDSEEATADNLDRFKDLKNVEATCGADRIGAQGSLEKGASLKAGDYKLTMQSDGNLVEYKGDDAVWSTKTDGKGTVELTLQSDGNLVAYNKDGKATWSSGTKGKKPGWLVLGKDGSLNLYDDKDKRIWKR